MLLFPQVQLVVVLVHGKLLLLSSLRPALTHTDYSELGHQHTKLNIARNKLREHECGCVMFTLSVISASHTIKILRLL